MNSRAAILLFATAASTWSLSALAEQPSTRIGKTIEEVDVNAVNPMEALADGFEEAYARADKTGLKVAPEKVDSTFLIVPMTTIWQKADASRLARFQDAAPPKVEDVEWETDNLNSWLAYLEVKATKALETNDRTAYRAAVEDMLFISASTAEKTGPSGPLGNFYVGSLGQLIGALDPVIASLADEEINGLLRQDAATIAARRARLLAARRALPVEDKAALLAATAQFLALRSAAGSLSDEDSSILEIRSDLLAEAGDTSEVQRIAALSTALQRKANIEQYNAAINFRQVNIEIFNFDSAAVWGLSGLKAARTFMDAKTPKLLRYSMLVLAEAVAGNKDMLAQDALEVAKEACAAQSCGSLENTSGFREGVALLKQAKLGTATERFRASVRGTAPVADGTEQTLLLSKIERNLCYNGGETDVRSPSRYTRAGERHAAKCDLDYGLAVIPLLEARGDKVESRGEIRDIVQSMAIASSRLGDWKTVSAQAGRLYKAYRSERDDYIALSIVSGLFAEAQIELKDFAGADRTLSAQQEDIEKFYAAGDMLPLHYRNALESIAQLRVQRLLAEDSRAAEAFPLARDIAERQRAFREGLSSTIEDETVLTLALQFTNRFTPVIDAAYARRTAGTGQGDAALSAAFLAAQDATLDPTSIAIGMSAAALSSVSGDPELVRMVERRRLLLDELAPFLGIDAQANFSLDPKEALVAKREEVAVQTKLEEYQRIDATLRQRFPEYDELVRPRALSVEEARALMQKDEATLLIVPTERGAHSLLVTREGVSWARAPLTADQLADTVERLLWFAGGAVKPDAGKVSTWEQAVDGGRNGFDRDTAFLLYQQLIAPHRAALAGKRKLYVSALGALSSLPLGLLVTAAPQGRDDDLDSLRQTKWLGDELVLAQLPSLQSLAFLRRGSAPHSVTGGSFLGVGDPVLDRAATGEGSRGLERVIAPADVYGAPEEAGAETATLLADIESLRKLPELKGTGRELRAMAEAFSAGEDRLRLRERARESGIKNEDLTGVSILAFATHGLLAGELRRGQSPGLVLTPPDTASATDDGLLTAPEIARLKLAADWVILSACNTAAGDGSDGAGALSGLARAFFTAGARSLLVSHWPVLDDLSATVTVKAITLRRSNPALSPAEAFQQAQREVRSEPRWAHPRSWAPFAFIGDASLPQAKAAQR